MADFNPKEYKVESLRDCPVPEQMQICEEPQQVADYWRMHITTHPYFNPECECFVVLLLNTRRRVKGHHLVSIGTMDTILIHAREVFRTAIVCSASAIAMAHNGFQYRLVAIPTLPRGACFMLTPHFLAAG